MYQLVIQFPAPKSNVALSGFEALVALENDLIRDAYGRYEVDGHDAGAEEMNIFIITADARATLRQIQGRLPADGSWRSGFRDLDAEDYVPLAPPGLVSFEVR